MSKLVVVETLEELNEIVAKGGNLVVDVFATWCAPCKSMASLLESSEEDLGDIYKVDIENVRVPGVRSVPTFIRYNGGNEVDRRTGTMTLEEFKDFSGN